MRSDSHINYTSNHNNEPGNALIPLFDGHCDTLSLDTEELMPADTQFSPHAQVFSIWGGADRNHGNCYLPLLHKYMRKYNQLINHTNIQPYLSVEGAHILDCSLERLRESAADGVRMVALTWNNANILSGSCASEPDRGLSPAGKRFATECGKLNIIADVSHLSDRGIYDLLDTGAAVAASHSNSRAVCEHPRNLTDSQFKLIAKANGVVGINLYRDFVGGPTISDLVKHFLHFLQFDKAEHTLAIGTDFDGGIIPVDGLETHAGLIKLYNALICAAVPETVVRSIFYANWNRLFNPGSD